MRMSEQEWKEYWTDRVAENICPMCGRDLEEHCERDKETIFLSYIICPSCGLNLFAKTEHQNVCIYTTDDRTAKQLKGMCNVSVCMR